MSGLKLVTGKGLGSRIDRIGFPAKSTTAPPSRSAKVLVVDVARSTLFERRLKSSSPMEIVMLLSTELETVLDVVRRKKEEAGGLRVLLMSVRVVGEKSLASINSSNTSIISLAPISTLNSIRSGGLLSATKIPTLTAEAKPVILFPAASVTAPSPKNM